MAMFKIVAETQLKMVFMVFLLGTLSSTPTDPANACGWDLYCRVVVAQYSTVLYAISAALLLFMVSTDLRMAESAAARAAETRGTKAFGPDGVGIGSITAGWTRLWLRGKLLLAAPCSFAASVCAVVAYLDGFRYRTGCGPDNNAGVAGYGSGSLLGLLLIGVFALVHGFFAWVAVTQN
jgi:hypothetical protein